MYGVAQPIQKLIDALESLPGIGPKSASRLAFHILRMPDDQVQTLAESIASLKENILYCSQCQNLSQTDPCEICNDPGRDRHLICVVEDPMDVVAIERTHVYKGLYHVLHGVINPVEGIGPEDLYIQPLLERLQQNKNDITEILIATNPNMEGEATAMYLARLLHPQGVRVTRLARGLPVGGDLEYADEVTLSRSLEGRRDI